METAGQKTYGRIGKCVINGDGEIVKLEKEYYRQGWIFKDEYAFCHEPGKPCYVPEEEEENFYTREDFIALCNGQEEIAEMIFDEVDWQHPETCFDEQFQYGELDICQSCHKIFVSYDVACCPYCGAERTEEIGEE